MSRIIDVLFVMGIIVLAGIYQLRQHGASKITIPSLMG